LKLVVGLSEQLENGDQFICSHITFDS